MSHRRWWIAAVAIGFVAAGGAPLAGQQIPAVPAGTPAPQVIELNAMQMLDRYESDQESALPAFDDALHIDSVWDELKSKSPAWIKAKGPADVPRRQLVLAAFVAEVVHSIDLTDAGALGVGFRLLEWACDMLREQPTPLPAERAWHLAVIGLLERQIGTHPFVTDPDIKMFTGHLVHATHRFPDEPRFLLAQAWIDAGQRRPVLPGGPLMNKLSIDHIWDPWEIDLPHLETYQRAMADPRIAAEAHVDVAAMYLARGRAGDAIAELNRVDTKQATSETRYLHQLLLAWADSELRQTAAATLAFRHALVAMPDAQTAALGLAANLILAGDRDEASGIVDRALTAGAIDPWVTHKTPEWGRWTENIADLRRALK